MIRVRYQLAETSTKNMIRIRVREKRARTFSHWREIVDLLNT